MLTIRDVHAGAARQERHFQQSPPLRDPGLRIPAASHACADMTPLFGAPFVALLLGVVAPAAAAGSDCGVIAITFSGSPASLNCTSVTGLTFDVEPPAHLLADLAKIVRVDGTLTVLAGIRSLRALSLRSLVYIKQLSINNAAITNLTGIPWTPGAPLSLGTLALSNLPRLLPTAVWAQLQGPIRLSINTCPLLTRLVECQRCVPVSSVDTNFLPLAPDLLHLDVSGGTTFNFGYPCRVTDQLLAQLNFGPAAYSFSFTNCPNVTTFPSVVPARSVSLVLFEMPRFNSLRFMASVASAPLLQLQQLPLLRSLAGLENVTTIASLRLQNLPLLDSIAPVARASVLMFVELRELPLLTSVKASFWTTLRGPVTLAFLPSLASLEGMESLEFCESLEITSLPLLTTLSPLSRDADQLGVSALQVVNLPLLTDISALAKLRLSGVGEVQLGLLPRLCCPSFEVFSPTGVQRANVPDCLDCMAFGRSSVAVVPASGGIVFSLPFSGAVSAETVQLRFSGASGVKPVTLRRQPASTAASASGAASAVALSNPRGEEFVGTSPVAPAGDLFGELWLGTRKSAFNVTFSVIAQSEYLGPLAQAAIAQTPLRVQQVGGVAGTATGDEEAKRGTVVTLSVGAVLLVLVLSLLLALGACWPRHCCCGPCRCACPQPPRREHGGSLLASFDLLKVQLVVGPKEGALTRVEGIKTSCGGAASLAAAISVLFLVIAYIVQVAYDNDVSSVVLDPGVDRTGPVSTRFVMNATIVPATCVASACQESLLLAVDGFDSAGNFTCAPLAVEVVADAAGGSPTVLPASACRVSWTCERCFITASSTATVSVLTRDPNAWSLGLNYSVQTTSYDGAPSVVVGNLFAKPGLLYKGFPYPSVLVTATSAQYRYYQDDSKEGVVVKFNSVSPGSQLAQDTFGRGNRTGLVFQVAPSEAVLSVRVTAKQSAIAILAQVLAIVTGIANFAVAFLKSAFKFQGWFCVAAKQRQRAASAAAMAARAGNADADAGAGAGAAPADSAAHAGLSEITMVERSQS